MCISRGWRHDWRHALFSPIYVNGGLSAASSSHEFQSHEVLYKLLVAARC